VLLDRVVDSCNIDFSINQQMAKNMTDQEKKDWMKLIIMSIITIISTLIIFAFTFGKETKYSETKELKDKVTLLDLNKANKTELNEKYAETMTYIDKQDNAMRNERLLQFESIKVQIDDLKQGQNKILDKLDRALGLKYIKQNTGTNELDTVNNHSNTDFDNVGFSQQR
jgi:hypothetical protein